MSKRTRVRAAAVAREHKSPLKISDQSIEEINPSKSKTKQQVYYDNANEQLMNAGHREPHESDQVAGEEEEEEFDEQDERHHLIERDAARRVVMSQAQRGAVSRQTNGHRDQDEHNYHQQHQVTFVPNLNDDLHNSSPTRRFLTRLGGFFTPGFIKLSPQKSTPTGIGAATSLYEHTADFVYQSDWGQEEATTREGARGSHRGASPTSHYDKSSGHKQHGSHWPPPTPSSSSRRRRQALQTSLFLVLLAGVCVWLVFKLASLIQDERRRLIGDDGSEMDQPARTRQDLVDELTQQLDKQHQDDLELDRQTRWLVSSPKCHIPVLEAWDKSIENYVNKKEPMNCSAILEDVRAGKEDPSGTVARKWSNLLASSLSFVHSNRLYFNKEALKGGALSTLAGPGHCCLKRASRVVDSDDDLEWSKCEPILEQGLQVNSSVVEINCASWNYTNVHSFVMHNQEEEAALVRVGSEKLSPNEDYYSVIMVGVDTISRLNGQRQLGKTLQTLNDLYNTLDFVGYNKVGENTFPNLIPLLTGLTPQQLSQVQCWQTKNYSQEHESGDDYLDNCKFLWNYYQQVGYMTYFGEDWPQASTFNYLKPGFKYAPTTFYGRPFTLARDPLIYPKFQSIGCASCQLDKPLVEIDLNNLKNFIESNSNKLPYFAFHWINCPQHDDLNGASQVDHLLEKFFRDLRERLEADRTFVVFFSDHGYRWNDFVSTRVGHYESSLPLMTIAPPKQFIERHPDLYERLKAHRNTLLTPFDIFKTLIELKDLSSSRAGSSDDVTTTRRSNGGSKGPAATSKSRRQSFVMENSTPESKEQVVTLEESLTTSSPSQSDKTTTIKQLIPEDGTTFNQTFRTLSLFKRHSPEQLDRGCQGAGIPDNYCVCHQFEPVASTNRTDILGAAYYLVYVHFEARIRNHLNICHRLDLERVHHAEMFDLEKNSNSKDKTSSSSRRKRSKVVVEDASDEEEDDDEAKRNRLTTPKPAKHLHGANDDQNKHDYLPNREYSIMVSTKPGGGLFQEVVRFYGANMTNCELEIDKTRKVIEDEWAKAEDKRESVLTMNDVCDFSVHSESLSRFNLYKDQSKCVKSNIELKKICYCNDLMG